MKLVKAKPIPEGRIVVAACAEGGIRKLSFKAKCWFGQMGSREVWHPEFGGGLAFIGEMGAHKADEKMARDGDGSGVAVT